MNIIKICLLALLSCVVFFSVRFATTDQGFISSGDNWLEQFQTQAEAGEHDNEEDQEEEAGQSDDEDDDDVPSRVVEFEGLPAVKLSDDIITRSGIQLAALTTSNYLNESMSIAQVVDIQDLIKRRAEFLQASGELRLVEEELRASSKIYQRLRVLHKERANISLRQVEEARSQMTADKTRVDVAKQSIKSIRRQTLLHWGTKLTDSAFGLAKEQADSDAQLDDFFDRLLEMQDVLILFTLPSGDGDSAPAGTILVNSLPERSTAVSAKLISPALQSNSLTQGLTFYYQVPAENFRTGMNLSAWFQQADQADSRQGLQIPETAVIWYAGQAWVYVKVANELYSRYPIKTDQALDSGWFVNDTFLHDKQVVNKGAQLLLSEELRWQIPDEDDD